MPRFYAYLLRCSDGSLYCGSTDNLDRRLALHNSGKGSKCVRSRLPAALAYKEWFSSRAAAMRREREIKGLSKKEKEGLVSGKRKGLP